MRDCRFGRHFTSLACDIINSLEKLLGNTITLLQSGLSTFIDLQMGSDSLGASLFQIYIHKVFIHRLIIKLTSGGILKSKDKVFLLVCTSSTLSELNVL